MNEWKGRNHVGGRGGEGLDRITRKGKNRNHCDFDGFDAWPSKKEEEKVGNIYNERR